MGSASVSGCEEFQRDAAAELRIVGEKHVRHAAGAELGANDVPTELLTRCDRIHDFSSKPLTLRSGLRGSGLGKSFQSS